MKILITGGAGFIGQNLTLKLQKLGHHVVVLDSLESQIHGTSISSDLKAFLGTVRFYHGSVLDKDLVVKAIEDIDLVFHLAAETGTGQSMYDISKYVDVNVKGTAVLLESIFKSGAHIKKIFLSSSRSIYGEGKYSCSNHGVFYPFDRSEIDLKNKIFDYRCPICNLKASPEATDEISPSMPKSLYALTKWQQEELFQLYAKILPVQFLIYRFQNVYGPGQSLKNPYTGVLSIFSSLIRAGKDISIFEDGVESRDFVYIEDVVSALISGIDYDKVQCPVFNVGSGERVSINEVIANLRKFYSPLEVKSKITGEYRVGDIRHNYADLKKIKTELGYEPSVNFQTGLSRFLSWASSEECSDISYSTSLAELKQKGLLK